MSRETLQTLNTTTLIGYTDKRGHAWHYRKDHQGTEPNHYPTAIPVADIHRRLFNWKPLEAPITATALTDDGVLTVTDDTRKAIVRPDTQTILGVFSTGYQVHDYGQWLVDHVEAILDDDLQIGSAGLLRGGAVAWVQVELNDTITGPGGIDYRPFLTATTSLDGSIATTYQTGAQVVVCDNTLSAALREDSPRIRIKHSSRSLGRLADVRQALDIVHTVSDSFNAQVEQLLNEEVNAARWAKFLNLYTLPTDPTSQRATTIATTKADALNRLWRYDDRVAPWAGTAYGVIAAVNTYTHHEALVRGSDRSTRNAERMITGKVDELDRNTLKVLAAA